MCIKNNKPLSFSTLCEATKLEVYSIPSILYVILPSVSPCVIGASMFSFKTISGSISFPKSFWFIKAIISSVVIKSNSYQLFF